MTDDQFHELKQLILNLSVRIEALELHLSRNDELADHRLQQIYQWCAPFEYKQQVEHLPDPIGIPVDLKKLFSI
jgi:hypothetical protein